MTLLDSWVESRNRDRQRQRERAWQEAQPDAERGADQFPRLAPPEPPETGRTPRWVSRLLDEVARLAAQDAAQSAGPNGRH
jgi:hypothetical protein